MFRPLSGALLCLLLASAPAVGQSAFLVKDINTTTYDSPPVPYGTFRDLRAVGGKLYFLSESLGDLWVSDGTTFGTELLRDLCPEDCFNGDIAGSLGNLLLWSSTSNGTQQLWRTDGTRPGTFPLTGEDQSAFGYNTRSEPRWAVFRDALYFSSCSASGDCDLWKTDGTVGGTRRQHQAEGSPGWVVADAGRLFYLSRDAEEAADLWVTDGTEAGTVLLRHFEAGEYTRSPVLAGGRLFFVATTDGDEVWTSDGTPGGTRALTQFAGQRPFSYGEWLEPKGSRVYFVADDGTHGNELWRTDGTPAGTVRVTELVNEDPFGSESASFFTEIGGTVVFKAWDGQAMRLFTVKGTPASTAPLSLACVDCDLGASRLGIFSSGSGSGSRAFFVLREGYMEQLWVTDGTAAGTFKLKDLCSFCGFSGLRPWQSGVLVAVGGELWFSDGTVAGTRPLTDLGALRPREDPLEVAEIGGKLYLLATDGNVDSLWVADGPGGTRPVLYYPATAPTSDPGHLVAYGDRLFFKAWNRQGTDLWWTSGTPESTGSFNEAVPVPWYESSELVPAAGVLFFQVGETYESFDLWRTDGTAPGTFPLVHMPGESVLVPYQGKLYFFNGREIWKSDGTFQGTVKTGDLPADLESVREAAPGPNGIYLDTVTAPYKTDFWFTDGTSAGTRQITDFNLSGVRGGSTGFTRLGAYMYFPWEGKLWRTDGTLAGTAPLSLPLPSDAFSQLTAHQGLLYFLASDSLWRTDGTATGTVLLRTLSHQNTSRYPIELQPFGGKVFFSSTDGVHGVELWETDGTPEGTRMVSDLHPGPDSSGPQHLTEAGSRLFFSAWDDRHGIELWQSDGTAAGTRLVQDIAPGVASSRPEKLTVAGDHLYFTADDRLAGRELWTVPLAAASGCKPASTRLCLNGGRYAVEAAWRDFQGNQGSGHAVSLTSDTGYFWFFDEKNVEVVLKVLDGRGVNGHVWVFYGALSTVQYTLTVTDTQTGISRRYVNPTGQLASVGDTRSFGPLGAASRTGGSPVLPPVVKSKTAAAGVCEPSPTRLCLNGDRFAVEATWKDFQGNSGVGKAVELTPDTGYFWFFNQENVEVVLKVLNGLPVNGYHWVFYGALSSVEYTLTVTDTVTGATNTYRNPSGSMSSRADTGAFIE